MDATNWRLLIGGATLFVTIIIGILQLLKKSESIKETTITSFREGDAINGHKANRDIVSGDNMEIIIREIMFMGTKVKLILLPMK